ncbi:uncharacterized protein [Nerophis lumbriciformis]|uniref:uncharacterized protein n=1 Tax=Nerophis lumbriciformis TaxID=546530 RepID=UPI002ADF8BCB|nr:probable E3 ubiquitin-protein ligase HERC4 [Nerophis lumbriciformis]
MSKMWFWGESSCGVFGPKASLTPVSWTVPNDIIKVFCGDQHVLLLREEGTLLSQGSNSRQQLGRRASNNEKAGQVEGLHFVVGVACGQYHSLALSSYGKVFSWGAGEAGQLGFLHYHKCDSPQAIRVRLPTEAVQVACGDFHSVALTKGGDVFCWGSNSHGQLGVGRQVSLQYVSLQHAPLLVGPLTGVPVTQISAGATHTLFLTLSGLVYCCGANKHGQLGLNRVDPKGFKAQVKKQCLKEFVAAFVDHVFNKSVEDVFNEFKRGFLKVCAPKVLDFFLPEELQAVMVGNEKYDWDVFEQNTVYVGEYHAQHRNILTFWQVFHKLSQEEKKKFLLFLTGSHRVPVEGMARIRMKVGILPDSTELHYPEALICLNILLLPLYPRYPMGRQMHNRLVYAINQSRGFSKTYKHQAE